MNDSTTSLEHNQYLQTSNIFSSPQPTKTAFLLAYGAFFSGLEPFSARNFVETN